MKHLAAFLLIAAAFYGWLWWLETRSASYAPVREARARLEATQADLAAVTAEVEAQESELQRLRQTIYTDCLRDSINRGVRCPIRPRGML